MARRLTFSARRLAYEVLALREWIGSGIAYNPFARATLADPYAAYRRLREHDPVHRSHVLRAWVLTRHDDVVGALREPRLSSDTRRRPLYHRMRARFVAAGLIEEGEFESPGMLNMDPPEHTRLRTLVNRGFTPRAVAGLRGAVTDLARELLDRIADRPSFDVLADYAAPLGVITIARLLGVPPADHPRIRRFADVACDALGAPTTFDGARIWFDNLRELRDYLFAAAEERRVRPTDDLISRLLHVEVEGDRLTLHEMFELVGVILVAGSETTANLIANGLLTLFRHPDSLAAVRKDPGLLPAALEEALRYDSPVQMVMRIATDDLVFSGRRIAAGDEVAVVIASANRDPAFVPEPDRFDPFRAQRRHYSFGHGTHFCLGAQLARLVAEIAIDELLARRPGLGLHPQATVHWKPTVVFRGLETLQVAS
jgi:cytochrome P450 PksS